MGKNNESELTVREATILALERSGECFGSMKTTAMKTAALFASGLNQEGLVLIQKELHPAISALYSFSIALVEKNSSILGKENVEKLAQSFEAFDKLLNDMKSLTVKGDFKGIGLLLETRFQTMVTELSAQFPVFIQCFRESKDPELDSL